MCTTPEDPGPIRSLWDRLTGRPDPEPAIILPDVDDVEALSKWVRGRALASGKDLCRRCGCVVGDEPGETCGLLDRRLCYACDVTWLEDEVLRPLVKRLRRRGTRRALRRLVRRAKALV
jgi:hypothetical protein